MKKLFLIQLIMVLAISNGFVYAQETTEWEPQKNITGYIATEFDYFKDIKYFDRNYGIAVTEAGVLASYNPIEKLSLKAVVVYRPNFTIEQMVNEANAEYKFSDYLKVKAGRFLTPLSPMNTYYYAPVNNSATLPMIIANHEFFPLNMDAVSVNGKIGENFKMDYEGFFGGFRNSLWLKTGALGIFSYENNYFQRVMTQDTVEFLQNDENTGMQIGGGGHLVFSYKEYVTLGFNIFNSAEIIKNSQTDSVGKITVSAYDVDKLSYGANLKVKLSTFQLLAEYWKTDLSMVFYGTPLELTYKGAFVELSNSFGKITPYVRYEYHSVPSMTPENTNYYRYTGGINYKPIFETTLKLEYMYYKYQSLNLSGLVATLIYSF
jgi:hypothetical protein